jgi:tRNA (mo5U34)-methyltransferase
MEVKMNKKEILGKINRVKFWLHRIDLGDGICTHGESLLNKFDRFVFTDELRGKTVLDIGAWDGYQSFKAEQYGAKRVLATDVWYNPPFNEKWWNNIRNADEGFQCAREILNSSIEQKNIDVFEMNEKTVGKFDVVFFLGTLYHLQYPLKALQIISGICIEMLLLETAVAAPPADALEKWFNETPLMKFRGESGWFPNKICVEQMLTLAGFKKIDYSFYKPNPLTDRDIKFGTMKNDTCVNDFDFNKENEKEISKGTPVIILNTDLGNMDISNPAARLLRIQWSLNKFQGWVDKEDVEITKRMPGEFDINKRQQIKRIQLRAYK